MAKKKRDSKLPPPQPNSDPDLAALVRKGKTDGQGNAPRGTRRKMVEDRAE
ncbi:MAG: hypothetical protein BIP78_0166 [Candidatus Bipolaricaulis sibiricus]|uniref:Uncharacterized protein n=1 Tax=Bipolaricaulis sibiricus TaxID=2501609 RepID=A0A410FSG8_BIPS1|nr:MAG: hypothetical protein BIP78_0166 [Candidatus Bipolaricaulis sibiricus]